MSHSPLSTGDTGERSTSVPRAVIHKKILDVAESRPTASMEAIADDVSGATVAIVDQVLEEYGDPGASEDSSDDSSGDAETDERQTDRTPDSSATASDPPESDEAESAMTEHDSRSDTDLELSLEPDDVTEKQRETLVEIYRRPDATQAALAETLGVSSATISQRVNAIDEFHWADRHEFVEALFDDGDWFDDDAVEETPQDGPKPESDLNAERAAVDGPRTDDEGTDLEESSGADSSATSDVDRAAPDDETPVERRPSTNGNAAEQAEPASGSGVDRVQPADASGIDRADPAGAGGVDRAEPADAAGVERTEPGAERNGSGDSDAGRGPESQGDTGAESHAFTRAAADPATSDASVSSGIDGESVTELTEQLEAVTQRLESLEQRLEDDSASEPSALSDPELAHKVVHACLSAENISEDEELRLLKEMAATDSARA
ncbi:winged helix-turn-helix transcriptional regulator [Natronorubrum sp. DTA7]|uniref:winged helix-turn-helix transcriptional regulator n=1 Tax=Natronorubrum sp. DTA7 TaxID=3447016 RepID=UPI003F86FAB7